MKKKNKFINKKIILIALIVIVCVTSLAQNKAFATSPIYITQNYGKQKDGSFHHGIDIAVPSGKLIITKKPGLVIKAEDYGVYGLTVIIDHGDIQTLYGHNSKLLVKSGDKIKAGEGIAITGNTGKSTGNHIHFEIRVNGKSINPYNYLKQ